MFGNGKATSCLIKKTLIFNKIKDQINRKQKV